MISLHGEPNNQAARPGRLQEDYNVQIMQLWKSEISARTMTAQVGINTRLSPSRKKLVHDYYIKP